MKEVLTMYNVIAFDVSMGHSAMVIYDQHERCQLEKVVHHTQAGFKWLHGQIEQLREISGQTPDIVFEATGVYSQGLEKFLQSHQYAYTRLNPLEAKMQTDRMRRQKTDLSDAHELAKSHFTSNRLKTYVQDDYFDQMRGLGRYTDDLEKEIQICQSRLHAFLQLSFPLLETKFTKSSLLYLNIVQFFPHVDYVHAFTKGEICKKVRQSTRKNLSTRQVEEYADQIISAATQSFPAISSWDVRCQHIQQIAKRLVEVKKQKKETLDQMVELSKSRKDYQVLLSFPGIGKPTAVQIIAEIGDINRFENAKQINAYTGIDIKRYQSGKMQYRDQINKRGNRRLRKILYHMVTTMITHRQRTKNHLVDYYDHLKKQPQNKLHKVAVVACINKFIRIAFHLIQQDILYNYDAAKANT